MSKNVCVQDVEAPSTCAQSSTSTSVLRKQAEENGDILELLLPKNKLIFAQSLKQTLLNSEVHVLLEHRKQHNESAEEEQKLSEVFVKTLNSTVRFSHFKNRQTTVSVHSLVP
ncbi:hypothetical protein ACRRTK_012641 [Alexandromys fortis]